MNVKIEFVIYYLTDQPTEDVSAYEPSGPSGRKLLTLLCNNDTYLLTDWLTNVVNDEPTNGVGGV